MQKPPSTCYLKLLTILLIVITTVMSISCVTAKQKFDQYSELFFAHSRIGILTYCYFPATPGLGDDIEYEKYISPIIFRTFQLVLEKNNTDIANLNNTVDRSKILEPLSIVKNYINPRKLISNLPKNDFNYIIIVQISYSPWKLILSDGQKVYKIIGYKINILDAKTLEIKESIELSDQNTTLFERDISKYKIANNTDTAKYKAFIAGPLVRMFAWIGFYRLFDDVTEELIKTE